MCREDSPEYGKGRDGIVFIAQDKAPFFDSDVMDPEEFEATPDGWVALQVEWVDAEDEGAFHLEKMYIECEK